jgi:hypothetical protein
LAVFCYLLLRLLVTVVLKGGWEETFYFSPVPDDRCYQFYMAPVSPTKKQQPFKIKYPCENQQNSEAKRVGEAVTGVFGLDLGRDTDYPAAFLQSLQASFPIVPRQGHRFSTFFVQFKFRMSLFISMLGACGSVAGCGTTLEA